MTMTGKCRDEEHFNKIPTAFCLKARVYDFDVMCEEDESVTEKIVDVEMIDYKTGHIWYNNGTRSTNFTIEPVRVKPIRDEGLNETRCPNCNRVFGRCYDQFSNTDLKCCYICGQALDWSDAT